MTLNFISAWVPFLYFFSDLLQADIDIDFNLHIDSPKFKALNMLSLMGIFS